MNAWQNRCAARPGYFNTPEKPDWLPHEALGKLLNYSMRTISTPEQPISLTSFVQTYMCKHCGCVYGAEE